MEVLLQKKKSSVDPLGILFIVIIVLLLAWNFCLMQFPLCIVSGASMMPTIENQDSVLVNHKKQYQPGDIIVFDNVRDAQNKSLIKRVIAVEGDTLRFVKDPVNTFWATDGNYPLVDLYIRHSGQTDFVLVQEDYIYEPLTTRAFTEIPNSHNTPFTWEVTVQPGCYFVMGDNRNNSKDSRNTADVGQVQGANISGKMLLHVKHGTFLEKFINFIYLNSQQTNENAMI